MSICQLVEIKTQKKIILRGLYFGKPRAKASAIFIHGLGGSVFSSLPLINSLVNRFEKTQTSFIAVNNRGHDVISRVKKLDRRKKDNYRSILAGAAHEIFADCVDDLQGMVNFAQNQGAKKIFFIGHSTGCQKSIYYLSRRGKQKFISGIVLLSPLSDYAGALKFSREILPKTSRLAKKLVRQGQPGALLPTELWEDYCDAQRFLSLYTPNSQEEIFSYTQPHQIPTLLKKIKIPVLAVFAEKDQYRDRSIKKIVSWFKKNVTSPQFQPVIIPDANHSFTNKEGQVAQEISQWLNQLA